MEITLFQKCVFEFLGTMILILMGDGVCANVSLEKNDIQSILQSRMLFLVQIFGIVRYFVYFCSRNNPTKY